MKNHLKEKRLTKRIKIRSKLKDNGENILSDRLQGILEKKKM